MMEKNIVERIAVELAALKREQVALDNKYRYMWHSGMATFAILDDIERARKRRVELEETLRILEEFQ